MKTRPNILTIAGFDPSGGAGILADIKTMEQNGSIGMAVQTANTIQTGSKFISCNWIDEAIIITQLTELLKDYQFAAIKIGLIPNLKLLNQLLNLCLDNYSKSKIIWDPVLSASAGFDFKQQLTELDETLKIIDFITPNWEEVKVLSGEKDAIKGAQKLAKHCTVILKGGHHPSSLGKDYLFDKNLQLSFNPKGQNCTPKHGSGCVFASALASNIVQGYPIRKSILRTKRYVERFLSSQPNLIGNHAP